MSSQIVYALALICSLICSGLVVVGVVAGDQAALAAGAAGLVMVSPLAYLALPPSER